jgi:flagellar biosynthesis/type III secretory pathway M-ring protein FliF/YscJ
MKKIILSLIFALTFLSISSSILAITLEEMQQVQQEMFEQQQQQIQEGVGQTYQQTQKTSNSLLAGLGIAFALTILFGIVSLIAFIWALVDILKSDISTLTKVGWVVLCIFLGVIGVIVYYFVVKRKKSPKEESKVEDKVEEREEPKEKEKSNFCHSCGKEAKQGAKFCPGCGEQL